MGRHEPSLAKLPEIERRLCDNVLRRLPDSPGEDERVELEDVFTDITYDLLTLPRVDFDTTCSIHPSESGGCPLRIAFGLRGFERKAPPDPDPKMIFRFEMGSAIHRILQKRYAHLQGRVMFEDEVSIDPQTSEVANLYSVTGHCDGIFTEISTAIRMGLEIKSASSKSFATTKLTDNYRKQATLYMACLGLDYMMFVFVNKDTARIESILYPFDENLWGDLRKKLDAIMLKVISGEPVDRTPNRIVCLTMCNFYWACRPEV